VTLINAETPVALGAQRSVPAVKGGIARIPWLAGMKEEKNLVFLYFCLHFQSFSA
jgi:hypothetical protein